MGSWKAVPAGNTGFEDTICISRRRPRKSFRGGPPGTGALLNADILDNDGLHGTSANVTPPVITFEKSSKQS